MRLAARWAHVPWHRRGLAASAPHRSEPYDRDSRTKGRRVRHFFWFQFPHTQLSYATVPSPSNQSTYRIIITCLRCAALSSRMALPLGSDISYDDMIDRR